MRQSEYLNRYWFVYYTTLFVMCVMLMGPFRPWKRCQNEKLIFLIVHHLLLQVEDMSLTNQNRSTRETL
jgi:hypothetical protein